MKNPKNQCSIARACPNHGYLVIENTLSANPFCAPMREDKKHHLRRADRHQIAAALNLISGGSIEPIEFNLLQQVEQHLRKLPLERVRKFARLHKGKGVLSVLAYLESRALTA